VSDLKGLFNDLVRFETELWNGIEGRLRGDFGLPLGSFDTMQVIARTETCRVYDIAHELSITVGGASKVVDRLESAGRCIRRSNPEDRRSSIVALTPQGEALLTKATVVFEVELERRIGSVLSARQITQLHSSLAKLRASGAQDREQEA
jgi:DNA-binding MarR family transcriptional regulator